MAPMGIIKHFALGKGVVSYKLVANHAPVNDKIIGTNEHESYFVLDMTYNNTSDIDIAAVSGDMQRALLQKMTIPSLEGL